MAYLSKFEHDVFISYCHVDNEVADGGRGWVDRFERHLKVLLMQVSGRGGDISIWDDSTLNRATTFDGKIEEAVRASGVLLLLLSRAYQTSHYCKQETEWFYDAAEKRRIALEGDEYRRVLPVLLGDVPPEEWPAIARGALGYPFYHREGKEAGWPLDPDSAKFRAELRGMTKDLWEVLQALQADGELDCGALECTTEKPPFRVFLASPPMDLKSTQEQLRTALLERGIEFFDEIPPPASEAQHSDAVRTAVKAADLSIHLLGVDPGGPVQGMSDKTYPVEQARIALDHARSQLILMPDEFDLDFVEDAAYREFIRSLTERERSADRLELVRIGRHQMLDQVLTKRCNLVEATRRQAAAPRIATFVDLHPKDWSRAGELVAYFQRKRIPLQMALSVEASLFKDALRKASLFLVVFGEVTRDWVVGRLNKAVHVALEEDLHFAMAVYLASRSARGRPGFGPSVAIVDSADRFDPTKIESLLAGTVGVSL